MKTITELAALCDYLAGFPRHGVIAVEGFTGSGKSHLANALSYELGHPVVHTDDFVTDGDETLPYPARIDYKQLRSILDRYIADSEVVLLEGICAREVLRQLGAYVCCFLYIKRLGENGLWYDGLHLEDFEADLTMQKDLGEPHLSDFKYHAAERPHETADVIFERVSGNS